MTTTPESDPEVVIYHGGCWDGWASVMIARRAVILGHLGQLPEPTLIPSHYGMDTPPEVDGRHVMICDFSFPPDQMLEIAARAKSVVWLDHHKSAIDAMAPHMDDFAALNGASDLDLDRSGARITWDWFHPQAEPPPVVAYVEDRDLWRFSLPGSRAVAAYIHSRPMTAEAWDELMASDIDEVRSVGRELLTQRDGMIAEVAEQAFLGLIGDIEMPIVTSVYGLGSDVCARLIETTGYDMAAYVLLNRHGQWQYGLRSAPGVDCSTIAVAFGGGGHPQACGFTSPTQAHTYIRTLDEETTT